MNNPPPSLLKGAVRLIVLLLVVVATIVGIYLGNLSTKLEVPKQTIEKKTEMSIAFWNVENLFDDADDPGKNDFIPPEWTTEKYLSKLALLTQAIKTFNKGKGADVLALAEVENMNVLQYWFDKVAPELGYQYKSLIEGTDPRSIDVALVSRFPFKKQFGHPTTRGTRNLLEVELDVFGNSVVVFVAHLKSRSSGEKETEAKRIEQATEINRVIQLRLKEDPQTDIIILGDFNDDPTNDSITKYLMPTYPPLTNGLTLLPKEKRGTYFWVGGGVWNEFDQILYSCGVNETQCGKKYPLKGVSIIPDSLEVIRTFQDTKGHPNKSYSDHFPIQARLSVWE